MLTLNPLSPEISSPHQRDCPSGATWPTIRAMHRTLVSCGLVGPDTMAVTASDGTVWLRHVERDEQGLPIPEQIDRWLNLLWAPTDMVGPETKSSSACSAAGAGQILHRG
jgi:hypothetical protein